MKGLIKYDAACRAVAAAKSIDEAKDIRDKAVALAAYARQAKNRDLEADAIEIRMRATRRLDQLRQAQKDSVGLNVGTKGNIKHGRVDKKPTLASQGIDKNLAHQARTLGALSQDKFEQVVTDARDAVSRAVKNVMRGASIEAEVEQREPIGRQTAKNLNALIAAGKKFAVIYADPPWKFKAYSGKGKQRSADRRYDTQSLDKIKAMPIEKLAAKDCALLMWAVLPEFPGALEVIKAWGFEYKTVAFVWIKQNRSGKGLFWGMGYWTRANAEVCLLATRGKPRRRAKGVHQVVMSPVRDHSRKPDEVRTRIQQLLSGPYIELFARGKARPGWTAWGNEAE